MSSDTTKESDGMFAAIVVAMTLRMLRTKFSNKEILRMMTAAKLKKGLAILDCEDKL